MFGKASFSAIRAIESSVSARRFATRARRLRHASLDPALPWSAVGDLTLIASPFRFREEEELAALEVLAKRAKGKWKSYYQFAHDRLKAKLDAAAK